MTRFNEIKEALDKIYEGQADILDKIYGEDLVNIAIDWFKYYQGKEDSKKMVELYSKLIDEETEETKTAWENGDIVEVLDGIVDVIWVTLGFLYFGWVANDKEKKEEDFIRDITMLMILKVNGAYIPFDLFKLAFLEIAMSNWSKSLELRGEDDKDGKVGKVVKGKNYKKPDLKRVFEFFKKHRQK